MGNDKSKQQNSKGSISKKSLSKKVQQDLNAKYEKINRMMEKVMNVPIENSQYRNNLNENYQLVLQFLKEEYQNFKQAKSLMLGRRDQNIKRIAQSFENLFNEGNKDSLPQIFEHSKIQDKITMTERKKLMIFYHISVLDKYQRIKCGGEGTFNNDNNSKNGNNSKLYETNDELRKKQRKELRIIVMNIIKDDSYFVVNPTLQRFNLIMEEAFYKDLKDKIQSKDPRTLLEFQTKLMNRLTKEEADFIFYSFQLITIVLTQNVQFLLQRILSKFIPEIFSGATDLYELIFCGQIVEKLLFRSKNRCLLQAAIQASFIQKNVMKTLNLDFDDRELAEFLQERSASMQYTMNPQSFADGLYGRQSMFNVPTLNQCISNNTNSNTLNNVDLNRAFSSQRNSSQGREKSPNLIDKKSKQFADQKTNANIKMIKQYANSRESFIIRNQPGVVQIRRHNFSNVSESIQQEKHIPLHCIQEEVVRQSNHYNESIFSEDNREEEKQTLEAGVSSQKIIPQNQEDVKNKSEVVIEVDDNQIQRSHLSAQYHQMMHEQQNEYKEITADIRISGRSSRKSQTLNQNSSNNLQEGNNYPQQEDLYQAQSNNQQEELVSKSENYDNLFNRDRDTFYGKDREVLYDRNRDTIYKLRAEKDRGFSQCLKNYLQEKYKKYLEEIYTLLELILNERSYFKKIKKAFKFVVKVQDRFAKNSVNFQASAHFIEEKENWYPILSMILKSYLAFKPQNRWDLYQLSSVINLVHKQEIEGTHLQDFQEHIKDILKLNESTESNLQSQVMTPIQFSEINNMDGLNDEMNIKDAQFDFIYNRNSISSEHESPKILNMKQSFLQQNQSYMNENSLIRTSTQ